MVEYHADNFETPPDLLVRKSVVATRQKLAILTRKSLLKYMELRKGNPFLQKSSFYIDYGEYHDGYWSYNHMVCQFEDKLMF